MSLGKAEWDCVVFELLVVVLVDLLQEWENRVDVEYFVNRELGNPFQNTQTVNDHYHFQQRVGLRQVLLSVLQPIGSHLSAEVKVDVMRC